jgi:hypothetical protein
MDNPLVRKCHKYGLSKTELAIAVGFSYPSIVSIMKGTRPVSNRLGFALDDIFKEKRGTFFEDYKQWAINQIEETVSAFEGGKDE